MCSVRSDIRRLLNASYKQGKHDNKLDDAQQNKEGT
jgi:hypothetical protein